MQLAPSALHETAETLTCHLGADTWQVNELIIEDIISLDGPNDRRISMRPIGDGSTIQMWATGGIQSADQEPTEGVSHPLPHGHRWHTPVHIGSLEPDKDPGVVLYNAISDRLLPVFDTKPFYVGHRPWDPEPEPDTDTQATAPTNTDQPEPAPAPRVPSEPTPEPQTNGVPMRTSRAKSETSASDKPTRPTRKRTQVKATPAKKLAAKRATADQTEPRPTRKRTPAKPASLSED